MWGTVADWLAAGAAIAAAVAEWKSSSTARDVAQNAQDPRRDALLREWRQMNATVIGEGGSCLAYIALLEPPLDSSAVHGVRGYGPLQKRDLIAGVRASVRSAVDNASRFRESPMHEVSIRDIDKALDTAHQHLAGIRIAAEQMKHLGTLV